MKHDDEGPERILQGLTKTKERETDVIIFSFNALPKKLSRTKNNQTANF